MIVDASVWVSSLIATDVHHETSQAWLRRTVQGGAPMAIPALALAEIGGAVSRRQGQADLAERAVARLLDNSAVRVVTIDLRLGRLAASIAARQRLRGADAVYVAAAQVFSMPLVTWDAELLQRAQSLIPVLSPTADR